MSSRNNVPLLKQIKRLPRDLKSKNPVRRKNAWITIIIILLIIAIVLMGVYTAAWYLNRSRIISESQRYQDLYASKSGHSPIPTSNEPVAPTENTVVWATPSSETQKTETSKSPAVWHTTAPESIVTADVQSSPMAETSAVISDVTPAGLFPENTPETAELTPSPTPESAFTPEPTFTPMSVITPEPMETAQPDITIEPLATANENTLVYALPTPPPVQSAFDELLSLNSDTIGFLNIDDVIALPVVQRENDNQYYLNHNFEQNEASEGTLFLDGANRLIPEDDCLIVYGHNMKNNTMFGRLESYANPAFLKKHPIIRFDTLYENRSYVPFAVFAASMESDSSHYFDVRQFVFDEMSFDLFTLNMRRRSSCDIPVDVRWGDRLLLLVTCDYINTSGRFILCLRQIREDESEDAIRAAVQKTVAN